MELCRFLLPKLIDGEKQVYTRSLIDLCGFSRPSSLKEVGTCDQLILMDLYGFLPPRLIEESRQVCSQYAATVDHSETGFL